jgi:hypothetical protein
MKSAVEDGSMIGRPSLRHRGKWGYQQRIRRTILHSPDAVMIAFLKRHYRPHSRRKAKTCEGVAPFLTRLCENVIS